ncbi:GCN5-related N-acetyltransferase OS=Tsukamurella paurometabola (strain ATCC 8368 / DSM / CCUG 35730 / CIP 100753 / JCM 10117 / KCTC 9821 / NBRC 16120 /NCIMB 702349 / NCTC 13040) OX=521096 GN=Tpau_2307 PE=4 SV=1 [Tsukamurella paurometabola]|uniref:GCN5-related N-acetyltransferase n=1 Tax=Tsukamurella paurometabola (strain ATCC 8368 / DSM 20162 / CCUG 35730 / CIP 100753 / JCM 10117 / KCTC 9821 / NBRC 16120 / NCIMB 702349 / NCTC 13040) TaxID=521096 RepID=D5UQE4_TSUPD|nr:GNAT family N-acetyltransferase [Tsukamurella paurometabola]ADG78914.1 GCN5-related N-acetyltransferase [Tsukamurella paurometabola DSM 20162]SUP33496.1 Predicted acetyltransferase [Tsukamurella paurometabola]
MKAPLDVHIETARLHLSPASDGRFHIVDRHSRRTVGRIALRASRHSRVRGLELSYSVASAHRRRGFCGEAARALVDHAFAHGITPRIYASTAWSNVASRRILAALGMHQRDIAMLDWESLAGDVDPHESDLTPYARVEYEMLHWDWHQRRLDTRLTS